MLDVIRQNFDGTTILRVNLHQPRALTVTTNAEDEETETLMVFSVFKTCCGSLCIIGQRTEEGIKRVLPVDLALIKSQSLEVQEALAKLMGLEVNDPLGDAMRQKELQPFGLLVKYLTVVFN